MYVPARPSTQRRLRFKAWVREGDAVEKAGDAALRSSIIFHIALGRMSTLRRILNTIIALRLVLINISLTLVLCVCVCVCVFFNLN